jgi:tRNA threonylcarbamoyladenosine biosynthesis protein TsaB
VALVDQGQVLQCVHLPEPSRQAELLVSHIEQLLEGRGGYGALTTIAVTVGPGSFTSVRIGLAVAQGLRLSLGIEAFGFTTLDCLQYAAPQADAVMIDASRGQCYWQWQGGEPRLDDDGVIAALLSEKVKLTLAGSGAAKIAPLLTHTPILLQTFADAATLAALSASGKGVALPLIPLYIRSPDAKIAVPLLGEKNA